MTEPALVKLRNTNPLGDVVVPLLRRIEDNPLKAGEVFEVDADTAGRLLAQSGNYEVVTDDRKSRLAAPAADADNTTPQEG